MRVVRLMYRRHPALSPNRLPAQISVREACIDRDGPLVARLAEALAATAGRGPTTVPTGRGLESELTSRPGRQVEAWLAVAAGSGSRLPLGLISLVRSQRSEAATARYSVGWLVVHPEARRQGVGRSLVAHACRRAWERGADEVWTETRADWAAAMGFWAAVGFSRG